MSTHQKAATNIENVESDFTVGWIDLEFEESVAVKNGRRGIFFAVVVLTSIDFGFVCSFLDQNVTTVNRAVNRPLSSKYSNNSTI